MPGRYHRSHGVPGMKKYRAGFFRAAISRVLQQVSLRRREKRWSEGGSTTVYRSGNVT